MAGPVAAYIQLPDDSGNSGKKVRSQTKVISGSTVHEHFFTPVRQAVMLGVYRVTMAQQTAVQNAQDGTSAGSGFLWFHVPTAITNKSARIRRIHMTTQHSTVLATPTAPRIVASRFTFTGTASGASVTPVKVATTFQGAAMPAAVADLRTAVTGLTVTLVGLIGAGAIGGALTAVGAYSTGDVHIYGPYEQEDEWHVIAPGEGVVLWQDTAGTASDTRKMSITLAWDEIDTA